MEVEIPFIREKIPIIGGPRKSGRGLFLMNSSEIFVNCAIQKFDFLSRIFVALNDFERILQKFISYVRKHVGEVHSSRDQHMISFIRLRVLNKALNDAFLIPHDFPNATL
jgi:hypothetical protein